MGRIEDQIKELESKLLRVRFLETVVQTVMEHTDHEFDSVKTELIDGIDTYIRSEVDRIEGTSTPVAPQTVNSDAPPPLVGKDFTVKDGDGNEHLGTVTAMLPDNRVTLFITGLGKSFDFPISELKT